MRTHDAGSQFGNKAVSAKLLALKLDLAQNQHWNQLCAKEVK